MRKGELYPSLVRDLKRKGSENRAKPQDRDVAAGTKPIPIRKHSERNIISIRDMAIEAYADSY